MRSHFNDTVIQYNATNGAAAANSNHKDAMYEGRIVLKGKVNEVNKTMGALEYRPGCLTNSSNHIHINITINQKRRRLEGQNQTTSQQQQPDHYVEVGPTKEYKVNLNVNSGQ